MAEYIDRESAISLIKQYGHDAIDGGRYSLDTVDDCIELANRIEALPTEDVAPVVHGHFVHDGPRFAGGVDWWHCSNCGRLVGGVETRYEYCPNCGAKMDIKDGGDNDGESVD